MSTCIWYDLTLCLEYTNGLKKRLHFCLFPSFYTYFCIESICSLTSLEIEMKKIPQDPLTISNVELFCMLLQLYQAWTVNSWQCFYILKTAFSYNTLLYFLIFCRGLGNVFFVCFPWGTIWISMSLQSHTKLSTAKLACWDWHYGTAGKATVCAAGNLYAQLVWVPAAVLLLQLPDSVPENATEDGQVLGPPTPFGDFGFAFHLAHIWLL